MIPGQPWQSPTLTISQDAAGGGRPGGAGVWDEVKAQGGQPQGDTFLSQAGAEGGHAGNPGSTQKGSRGTPVLQD